MTTDQIREKFLKYFESKEHKLVASDSLVPKDDPTVLFTTAGMQQFKRQFLGHLTGFSRATTSQKCLRTDDLDEVGETDFHHTFFEMLGNFSFGDYFKKEAIAFGWEFLTKELNIPEDRLCVSIYYEDEEAEQIWLNDIGVPPEKIFKLGGKSNYWPSNAKEDGPNGPCGPCSEIFYDHEPEKDTYPKDPDDEGARFCEVWNLVFTQFNRCDGGVLEPLPGKNIDTGMGLERLAAVLQGKKNNFDIDIFQPILNSITDNVEAKGVEISLKQKRIIADHMRAVVIGIADGVIPSNEGRGYIMKKLIVDITDIALQAGRPEPCIYQVTDAVIEAMGVGYPELKGKNKEISEIIENIESSYIKVRQTRIPELKKEVADVSDAAALGKIMFVYRDTFGLTEATIISVLKESNVSDDLINDAQSTFKALMDQQKEQSRQSSKMTGDVFSGVDINVSGVNSEFVGYDQFKLDTTITKIFVGADEKDTVNDGDEVAVTLAQTPFYAESGGQIGDIGHVSTQSGTIEINDTQKIDGIHVSYGKVVKGSVSAGDTAKVEIALERRQLITANHSATHLLQAALRTVLGEGVKQQGSHVSEERLRFDFSYHKAVTNEQIEEIEKIVNQNVTDNDLVTTQLLPLEEAKKLGALAFFAEKYGDIVRVVTIGDYSIEFCGGTHVASTDQIKKIRVTKEGSVAQGIRRIEAKTGALADEFEAELEKKQGDKQAQAEAKQAAKKQAQQAFLDIKSSIDETITSADKLNDITLFSNVYENLDNKSLRKISDIVKQKSDPAIIMLAAKTDSNASVLVSVTDKAREAGFKANEIMNEIAPLINGTGGGKEELAHGGSKEPEKIADAFKQITASIKEKN